MLRSTLTTATAAVAFSALCGNVHAQEQFGVVPNQYANDPGGSAFLYFATSARSYQMIIHENQLTDFIGMELNGASWRLSPSAASPWPGENVNFSEFSVFIGQGVNPADRQLDLMANYTGPRTQVRSGSLNVPVNSYSAGGSPVNDFGLMIDFDNWLYTGGNLVLEFFHTGRVGGTNISFEATGTSSPGYLTDFASIWSNGTSVFQGNFFVTQLRAVPGPGALAMIGLGLAGLAGRRRRA